MGGNRMKKIILFLFAAMSVFFVISCIGKNENSIMYKTGTYTATAQGMNGDVKVSVK